MLYPLNILDFAVREVICLKHRTFEGLKEFKTMPAVMAQQQDVLVAVNELLVAIDIARRAESHAVLLDAVSLSPATRDKAATGRGRIEASFDGTL